MEFKSLESQLPPDLLRAIKTDPKTAEALRGYIEQKQKHHRNPIYLESRQAFLSVQESQIDKGADKYPEPLNPNSWTIDELVDHGLMELVDQVHYTVSIRAKARKLRSDLQTAYKLLNTEGVKRDEIAEIIRGVLAEL
jgi:hypothetical protein